MTNGKKASDYLKFVVTESGFENNFREENEIYKCDINNVSYYNQNNKF
jgi:hypothetical protein